MHENEFIYIYIYIDMQAKYLRSGQCMCTYVASIYTQSEQMYAGPPAPVIMLQRHTNVFRVIKGQGNFIFFFRLKIIRVIKLTLALAC